MKRKNIVFSVLMVLLTWIGIEFLAIVGHQIRSGAFFPRQAIREELRTRLEDAAGGARDQGRAMPNAWRGGQHVEVLHPYFGFISDPTSSSAVMRIAENGFFDADGRVTWPKREPGALSIGILGGSFATSTSEVAHRRLPHCLSDLGRRIEVHNYAAGGYKQPQQLHVLAQLFATGAEFDFVVNIDGFNELGLGVVESARAGSHPSFPRQWPARVAKTLDPAKLRLIGRIEVLRERQRAWARPFAAFGLTNSPTLALIWQLRDQWMVKELVDLQHRVLSLDNALGAHDFQGQGPAFEGDLEARLDVAIALWRDASLQMHHLAEGNETVYLHLLQPNQYVDGSKPLSGEERKIAFDPDSPFRSVVRDGYPRMIEEGAAMRSLGVAFLDLTRIYEDVAESRYVDTCCHVDLQGYAMVVDRICETIRGRMRAHRDR